MNQTDELLNSLSEPTIEPQSISEPHIIVASDRTITVPADLKRIAVQGDHNVETVTFDCPRYWDGHDLSDMGVCINFKLSDGTFGSYEVTDVRVDESDDSIMHFDWTIEHDVTAKKGTISFSICIKQIDTVTGADLKHWNSEINSEMSISEGLDWTGDLDNNQRSYVGDLLTRSEMATTRSEAAATKAEEAETSAVQAKNAIEENIGDWSDTLDAVIDMQNRVTEGKVVNSALLAYPVGSIYMSVVDTDPGTIFGGTWERLKDRFLLGAGDTYTAGARGGEATHTLDKSEIPSHAGHIYSDDTVCFNGNAKGYYLPKSVFTSYGSDQRGWNAFKNSNLNADGDEMYPDTKSIGGGQPHNNMPPYLAVYMWKRIA